VNLLETVIVTVIIALILLSQLCRQIKTWWRNWVQCYLCFFV